MSEHYNLYDSLGLRRDASSADIAAELDARLAAHLEHGGERNDPDYDEAATARIILGDEATRRIYDARLGDPHGEPLTITSLRQLAGSPAPARRVHYRYEPVGTPPDTLGEAFRAAPTAVGGATLLALGGALISLLAMVFLYLAARRELRGMDALNQVYGVGVGTQVLTAGVVASLAVMAFAAALYCLHGLAVAAIALRGSNPVAHAAAVGSTAVLLVLSAWVWLMPLDFSYAGLIYVPYLVGLLVFLLLPGARAWAAGQRRVREVV
ncbi:hypothetical protein H7347_04405 [Corynebacterium sp. zg-331]|uniref:hypothetical protein n=1 Tax=unclassified Corynebacterium TaxID=2624378 RepID=UPI00128DBCA0|nr:MULTISPECIES: hypothetical protein [unclassified Corynebacterium]MBC3185821.1 hypothetical protein [Corynebacterium sp. zg-331]MPV52313.1 hypothetical protein [Corynebacterium sp. zg331]